MSAETCRKIKAVLIIAMLAGAEARNMDSGVKTASWGSGSAAGKVRDSGSQMEQAQLLSEQLQTMMSGPNLQEQLKTIATQFASVNAEPQIQAHAKRAAEQFDAMMSGPMIQEWTRRIQEQVDVMMADPLMKEESLRLAKQMEAMTAGPNVNEQVEQVTSQIQAMMANPKLKKQMDLVGKEVDAMKADPRFQHEATLLSEEVEATMADPSLQKQAMHATREVETMMSNPKVQQQAERMAEQVEATLRNPNALKQAQQLTERMQAVTADPKFQEQATHISAQVKGLMNDPNLQEQVKLMGERMEMLKANPTSENGVKLFADQFEAIETNPYFEEKVMPIVAQVKAMLADTNMQKHVESVAQQMQAIISEKQALKTHPIQESKDVFSNRLVHTLADGLFDRALRVSGLTGRLPVASTLPRVGMSSNIATRPGLAIAERMGQNVPHRSFGPVMAGKQEKLDRPPPTVLEDTLAGVTTAFSLLSKAIATSAMVGVNPLVGIWSSVVMGVTAPLLGSRPGVISGAAAVVIVPLAALTAAHGTSVIAPVLIIVAMIEFIFGVLRLSKLTMLVSDGVMAGFLNALGLILAQSQQKIFTKAPAFWPAVAMAALCIAIDRGLPFVTKAVPSSLVGLVVATGLGIALGLPLQNLASTAPAGTFAGGLSALPSFIDIGALGQQLVNPAVLKIVVPTAISISFISIIETLLAGRVVDEMTGDPLCTFNEKGEIDCLPNSKDSGPMAGIDTPTKSVLGGSVGKFISALLGGFGGCGLVPQTVLNVKSGGGGPFSSAAYALSMAAFVLFLAPLVGQVSMVALAGIMLTVAYDTIQWGATKDLIVAALPGKEQKTPGTRSEVAALIVTFMLCYKVDMAVGIVSGIITSKTLRAIGGASAKPAAA